MSINHKWALGLSGGGLRSCSASAIFCLAAMHTQIKNSSSTHPLQDDDNDDHEDRKKSDGEEDDVTISTLWDKFSRVIGISGGSWFISAFQAGAFRNLNESYTIDELLDVLQLSVVYSGDSLSRQEKIAHYLGKQSGVNIYHQDGVEENNVAAASTTTASQNGQASEEKQEPATNSKNSNDEKTNNVGGTNNSSNSITFSQRLLQHRDHLANSARNAIRSGFVNSVLRPVASILENKFGEGVVIAVTSETPLEEYQKYLKQRLLLVNNNNNEVAISSDQDHPSRNNSTSFNFGSIPSREDLLQTDNDEDNQQKNNKHKTRKNHSSNNKRNNKELWMTCIGSEDPALSRIVTYTPGTGKDAESTFNQPEWNPVSIKSASRSSWVAFSVSPSCSSSSTVFQISLFEEEIKSALPYQSKSNHPTIRAESSAGKNIYSGNRYRIQKRELIPLEPLNLERMCAFCGSAFSASASNILDHAVSNGLGTMLSSISATFFGKERQDQVHSSPVLGAKTVDAVKFFRNNTIINDGKTNNWNQTHQHHHQQQQGEELTLGLRDAGLEVNIPFLFLETDVFNVAFALDSGSDAEVGRQILWAQRRGHLGDYIPVFSPIEAKKISRIEKEENETKKFLEKDNVENNSSSSSSNASQNHINNTTNETTNNENITSSSSSTKQKWQIYLKDKSSDLGPSVIVYLIGLDDSELMEVKDVDTRLKKLKNRYEELKHEMKVITNWLTERGF